MTELCLEREERSRWPSENQGNVSRARRELLKAFVERMNSSGIAYCLLSGFYDSPKATDSDVDFMVSPEDIDRVGPLLQEVATGCGAMLVQAMQHETEACYFVMAKQVGCEVAFLHPDCSADYRRNKRLWMTAVPVLQTRRRCKSFYVPAVRDEFQYYVIKKILKQSLSDAEFERLRALYLSDPETCCQRIGWFWSRRTIAKLVAALMRHDAAWMRFQLPRLSAELRRSDRLENAWTRCVQTWREGRRWVRRGANPTGLSIGLWGGSAEHRADVATALERNLRPAFRRTRIVEECEGNSWSALSLWLAKVHSTLLIRKREEIKRRTFSRDELCFELDEATKRPVEFLTCEVLEWMAERLRKRTRLIEALSTKSRATLSDEGRP